MYIFQLGREFKLSIAELLVVFPGGEIVYHDKKLLILDNLDKKDILDKADSLGGTIKIIEIGRGDNFGDYILQKAKQKEGKFQYGISVFGSNSNLKTLLISTKNILKGENISSRFVNKNFENLSSSQIIGENLVERQTDFTILSTSTFTDKKGPREWYGNTIWVQNIESYSKRDYSKDRDMQVGMLPPKLSQMMINFSSPLSQPFPPGEKGVQKIIYDPFVGLGTILIESLYMGNTKVYGSDISDDMVNTSIKNIEKLKVENNIKIEDSKIYKLNAKFIDESIFLAGKSDYKIDSIITEGYLGEIMTKSNISHDRIKKQRDSLSKIYENFFSGLKKFDFKGNIIITFPFWELSGTYYYFEEIYKILDKYCDILPYFPETLNLQSTKVGSLLYKRKTQLVGRELFRLRIKNESK